MRQFDSFLFEIYALIFSKSGQLLWRRAEELHEAFNTHLLRKSMERFPARPNALPLTPWSRPGTFRSSSMYQATDIDFSWRNIRGKNYRGDAFSLRPPMLAVTP
jgi:hypothetical protein